MIKSSLDRVLPGTLTSRAASEANVAHQREESILPQNSKRHNLQRTPSDIKGFDCARAEEKRSEIDDQIQALINPVNLVGGAEKRTVPVPKGAGCFNHPVGGKRA